jgi:hypothetical protein
VPRLAVAQLVNKSLARKFPVNGGEPPHPAGDACHDPARSRNAAELKFRMPESGIGFGRYWPATPSDARPHHLAER